MWTMFMVYFPTKGDWPGQDIEHIKHKIIVVLHPSFTGDLDRFPIGGIAVPLWGDI